MMEVLTHCSISAINRRRLVWLGSESERTWLRICLTTYTLPRGTGIPATSMRMRPRVCRVV